MPRKTRTILPAVAPWAQKRQRAISATAKGRRRGIHLELAGCGAMWHPLFLIEQNRLSCKLPSERSAVWAEKQRNPRAIGFAPARWAPPPARCLRGPRRAAKIFTWICPTKWRWMAMKSSFGPPTGVANGRAPRWNRWKSGPMRALWPRWISSRMAKRASRAPLRTPSFPACLPASMWRATCWALARGMRCCCA